MAEFADSFPSSKGNFVTSYLQTRRGTRLKFCINKCFYGHNDPRFLASGPLSLPSPPGSGKWLKRPGLIELGKPGKPGPLAWFDQKFAWGAGGVLGFDIF